MISLDFANQIIDLFCLFSSINCWIPNRSTTW